MTRMPQRLLLAAVILLGAGCAHAAPPPLNVLMVVGGGSHDYQVLPRTLADRLRGRGEMSVEVTDDLRTLNAANLARYHVLAFNNCQQADLDEATREAILGFVRSGRGLVAMHCALWSFQDWPEWRRLIGGYVEKHGAYGPYSVTVLDPAHAAMRSIGSRFEITDEPYFVEQYDPSATLLIRMSQPGKGRDGEPRPGPDPQVWTKVYGRGRVFVMTFGHDEKSQGDERFITLLHSGIRWASGQLADTQHNALTKAEQQEGFRLLFNGRDLSGWGGDRGHWGVENGELVGQSKDLPHNVFLIHEAPFGDFLLRLSVKLRNHNSGVQFRSRAFPEQVVKGYQADIADEWYGSLYEEGGTRGVLANGYKGKGEQVVVPEGWNEMSIRAEGPRITIALNGLTTVEYVEKDPSAQPASGVIALQLHAGPPMEVRFRDIRIKPLSAATTTAGGP